MLSYKNQYSKLSFGAKEGGYLGDVMCFRRKKKGKSKNMSGGFFLIDLEAEE